MASTPITKQAKSNQSFQNSRQAGARWEETAELYLCRHGLRLIQRNFTSRLGEIDLIMEDDKTVVFVEVRYRKNSRHGSGAESINLQKQNKISRTAAWYLAKNPHRAEQYCRFDVISIDPQKEDLGIEWIQSAFYSTIG